MVPGSYKVTWSVLASDDAGNNEVLIYLKKNGEIIDESWHRSYFSGTSGSYVGDQGKNITQYYNNNK